MGRPRRRKHDPTKLLGILNVLRAMFGKYRRRTYLGLALMGTQAFLYNAIFPRGDSGPAIELVGQLVPLLTT